MLKEYNIRSLDEDSLMQIKDAILEERVIDGDGGVVLAEVLMMTLLSLDKRIPQNIIDATLKNNKGSTEKWAIGKLIDDWNNIFLKDSRLMGTKGIMIQNVSQSIAISDSSDHNIYAFRNLKLQNLQTSLDVISAELRLF